MVLRVESLAFSNYYFSICLFVRYVNLAASLESRNKSKELFLLSSVFGFFPKHSLMPDANPKWSFPPISCTPVESDSIQRSSEWLK